MEIHIGDIFTFNGMEFEVVEGACEDCYFQYINCPTDENNDFIDCVDGDKFICFKE